MAKNREIIRNKSNLENKKENLCNENDSMRSLPRCMLSWKLKLIEG